MQRILNKWNKDEWYIEEEKEDEEEKGKEKEKVYIYIYILLKFICYSKISVETLFSDIFY